MISVHSVGLWRKAGLPTWVLGLVPVLLLAVLLAAFLTAGPVGVFRSNVAPLEELTLQRIELREPAQVSVELVNGGPEPVTVAQVLVNDSYQPFTVDPGNTVSRLDSAVIDIGYDWVEGEPVHVTVLTSTGATFSRSVEAASETPGFSGRFLVAFALLGTYAGVIPVFLGLAWRPFIGRLDGKWMDFLLALTAGLLLILGFEALEEALTLAAEELAPAFNGTSLVLVGVAGAFLALALFSHAGRGREGSSPVRLAYLIALAVGLHNLGEGLAIGSSYAAGSIAVGSLLVVGFMLHNTTEGIAILSPLSRSGCAFGHLVLLGLIAGGPTVAGTWIGGFSTQPLLSVFFLALGAGAIFLVLYEVGRPLLAVEPARRSYVTCGFLAGLIVMYATSLLAG